uniref:Protein YIPF n=1 Tax=Panagrolaimus superbus TaxID=310955 RepID=A0A914Y896_9BILA
MADQGNWFGQGEYQGWQQFDYSQSQTQPGSSVHNQGSFYGNTQATPQMFIPQHEIGKTAATDDYDYGNEPPLLEELGINFDHIRQKTFAVLNPVGTASAEVIADQDLAGPLVFCLLFGASLLLHGKLQFGYIYGIGLLGCVGMWCLLNLMAEEQRSISFTCTASVLGYCLLPMSILSMLAAVLSLNGIIGYGVAGAAAFWCGSTSSKLFSITLQMEGQRLLVAYPCMLLYCVFALLAIF